MSRHGMASSVSKRNHTRLIKALYFASSSFDWYARRIANYGIDLSKALVPDYSKIPIVTREDLRKSSAKTDIGRYIDLQIDELGESPVITRVGEGDYEALKRVYRDLFVIAGVRRNDIILICDFGTSPVSYLSSSFYSTLPIKGLAERMGFIPLSIDGIPEFVRRTIHVIQNVRPRFLFIRHDVVPPLISSLQSQKLSLKDLGVCTMVITANCATAENESNLARKLDIKVLRLLRDDIAFFAMIGCESSQGFHIMRHSYFPESTSPERRSVLRGGAKGKLVVTNLFPTTRPVVRFETSYEGYFDDSVCDCLQPPRFRRKTRNKLFFLA